jgi:hypothetical protein
VVDVQVAGAGLRAAACHHGDGALGRVDVVAVLGHPCRGVGHPLVEIAEVERLRFRRGLADPLLVAVVAERDGARAERDLLRQIERGEAHGGAVRTPDLVSHGVVSASSPS